MVDLGQGVGDDLTGARPNSCSEAQRLTANGATEREEHGESVSSLTGAWMAVWRPELGLTAAPRHSGSPSMEQLRERSTGSPSQASPGRGWRCGDRAMVVKKRQWRHSVRATLGCGEKRMRTGRGVVEDGEAGAALTRAREAVRRLGDDGKAAAAEELGGGGSRARRREEESGDGCGEDRARASAFYRG
jgi:hypothetical protein